jgi:hypothetical protein
VAVITEERAYAEAMAAAKTLSSAELRSELTRLPKVVSHSESGVIVTAQTKAAYKAELSSRTTKTLLIGGGLAVAGWFFFIK